jgi:hypothetical protein
MTTQPTTRTQPFTPAGQDTESGTLKAQLTKLGLHSMAAHCEAEADRAAKSETTYTAYLTRLVEVELADKADRSINARITRARFPVLRTLVTARDAPPRTVVPVVMIVSAIMFQAPSE